MATPSTVHLPQPKSWDEFEDICADLFSAEWGDLNATRYGRQGQRQNGVDIYGTSASQGGAVGVQCKGRRAWPSPALTTTDIDAEVAKAKAFTPALRSLTIATTAPDDVKIQDHVRSLTEQHKLDDLFAVHVIGWGELTRRLTQHSNLIEKHYGFVALSSLRKDIQDIAARTAELVAATRASESVLTQAAPEDASAYDVFISHAGEDKDRFVRPLAEALIRRGLSVWYDEFSLTVGDSLTASIDDGLSHSRYGIVVLSEHFFAKRWTQRELGGLVSRETAEGKKLILPIWLGITRDQVVAASLIDGLALNYLQTTGLLDAVLKTFNEVYVDASAEEEATVLLDYGRQLETLATIVNRIRKAVHEAFAAGKVVFSPRRTGEDEEEDINSSATLNLISDLKGAEIAVFDDRMLNREAFVADRHAHRARTVTTLDLIEELRARGLVSVDERRQYRNRLRRGGAALVPVDAEEIAYVASRSTKAPSTEFRAIRDSFDLARVAGMARFPSEIPWFASICTETKNAVTLTWKEHPDRAAAISDFILMLPPTPEDWLDSWEGAVPPNWPDVIHRVLAFGLTLPIELTDPDLVAQYNAWLEATVLAPERDLRPSRVNAITDHLRQLITSMAKEVPDEA